MKKSIWIFLLAILLPGFVLGWLALRSAEEQQIIFERRTAELYQKETESLAAGAREAVEAERRAFGDTVHRLLAKGDAAALARDFTNSLTDAWPRKAVGFVLGPEGQMLSPSTSMAANNAQWREFLWNNGSFLCSTQPAVVYPVPVETNTKAIAYGQALKARAMPNSWQSPNRGVEQLAQAQKADGQPEPAQPPSLLLKAPAEEQEPALAMKLKPAPAAAPVRAPQPTAGLKDEGRSEDRQVGRTIGKADRAKRAADLPLEVAPTTEALPREPMPTRPEGAPSAAPKGEMKEADRLAVVKSLAPPAPSAPATASASGRSPGSDTAGGRSASGAKDAAELHGLKPTGASPAPAATVAPAPPALRSTPATPAVADPDSKTAMLDAGNDNPSRLAPSAARGGSEPKALKEQSADAAASGENVPELPKQSGDVRTEIVTRSRGQTTGLDRGRNVVATSAEPVAEDGTYFRQNSDLFNRLVEPQQQTATLASNWSAILPATADFRALTANHEEGMLARFVQDKLDLVFWIRPPEAPEMVFGCLIEAADLQELWTELFATLVQEPGSERPPYVLALLDDRAKPVATFPALHQMREWKRPFVASEIGEMLPHWEAALYLATPTAVADTARGLRRTLSFTIAGAIALIAIGGWLVVADVRRQLALAQQKTDFVSNVSHELKTPLTSIRMFAELMHDRPQPAEKQGQYLRIITVEAERLTRLINNVLDFAKLERRQKRFDKKPLDLCAVITRVWEGQEMHLRDAGFSAKWQATPGPYPVLGDEDALAQILVNLLSNAEKYSHDVKDIELVTWVEDGAINVSVLDRGIGVPEGEERKIFEAFYRAHDSLSSGIQGSGLGLTLAQRLAREHGGEIRFERRQGGGSRFTLRLPLQRGDSPQSTHDGDSHDRGASI